MGDTQKCHVSNFIIPAVLNLFKLQTLSESKWNFLLFLFFSGLHHQWSLGGGVLHQENAVILDHQGMYKEEICRPSQLIIDAVYDIHVVFVS